MLSAAGSARYSTAIPGFDCRYGSVPLSQVDGISLRENFLIFIYFIVLSSKTSFSGLHPPPP